MAKKDNTSWIIAIVLITVLIYGGNAGWFKSIVNITDITNNQETIALSPDNISTVFYIELDLEPNNICVGDETLGSIESNMPNAICSIYYNPGSWTLYKNVMLNNEGEYNEIVTIDSAGTALFRVVCYLDGEYAISNDETLVVEVCDDGSEGDSSDGDMPPMVCSGVWNPTELTCSNAICSIEGEVCNYIPATIIQPAKCACE